MKTLGKLILGLLILTFFIAGPAFADVVVRETHQDWVWGGGRTFVGDFFYLVGDIVSAPFNLLGSLF